MRTSVTAIETRDSVTGRLERRDGSVVDGFRIDHPDGLADPGGYVDRLRAAGMNVIARGPGWPNSPVSRTHNG